ncbi:hypothetical protein C1645_816609 [Glomus cerebriforme]|uniref:CST complex subunit STN1 n=1 Tax=Glomus cerebriforme TaxID=658196 RepID=A0A397TKZ7_9GLOM|nr:hypothetical protein C1645_816609 [Glomus cerebriforme]
MSTHFFRKMNNANFMSSGNSFTHVKQTWEYDPLCQTEVKLFIKDILNLRHVKYKKIDNKSGVEKEISVFYYGKSNRPIQFVDIIGIIRAIVPFRKVIIYYLDDGSSTIACVEFIPEDITSPQQDDSIYDSASTSTRVPLVLNKFNLSELVRISGIISEYKERKEIKIRQMDKIEDPNEELLRWIEIIDLKTNVYSKEYKITLNHSNEKGLLRDKSSAISSSTNKVYWHNISKYYPSKKISNNTSGGDDNIQSSAIQCSALQFSTVKIHYDEETLKRYIKEYINENGFNEFRFSRIVEESRLQEIAIKVLQSQGREIDNFTKEVKTAQGRNNNFKQYKKEITYFKERN